MSRLNDLIAGLCPDGVRHVPLSMVAAYSDTRVDAANLDETTFVGVDNLVADKGGRIDASYPPNTVRLTAYEPGDILLGNIRPYLKKVWHASNAGGCSGDVLAVRINDGSRQDLSTEFLYFVLSSDEFFAYNMQHAKGAKMPRGSKPAIMNFRIPVPPLAVQSEIVRILDTFVELEAELGRELAARRSQFSFYRDQLISESTPKRSHMGEIGYFVRGRRFTKSDVVPSGIPSIHYGEIYTEYGVSATTAINEVREDLREQLRFAVTGDVVIACVGETVEDVGKAVAWLGVDDVAIHDDTFLFRADMDSKFVAYALQTPEFQAQKAKHVARGKVNRLSGRSLSKVAIPVPAMTEQKRVVALLDKFDALVNDPNSGLPAEIAARHQQYEHYRNQLLNFEEAN